ncbi:MAG: GNAT family N-acetyltransferase [Anaerolineaceae bacterium]|nr:GNAT family N-acetyltransferase [Anaerolineaceae bacterium]
MIGEKKDTQVTTDRATNGYKPTHTARPTSEFNYKELADIYNQTRLDYIVPMPMNAKKMEEYVTNFSVDLDASVVVYNQEGQMAGLGMLGIRDDRAWITRLGVIPERRGKNLGMFMMTTMLDAARQHRCRLVQLEVIRGNTPAYRMFHKCGFHDSRDLLVVRRPPGTIPFDNPEPDAVVTNLSAADIQNCLDNRSEGASWLDESISILKAGNLNGLRVTLPTGESGWIVYQCTAFQLSFLVLHTPSHLRDRMALALLYNMHSRHPMQDTKYENIPAFDLRWPVFQKIGYVEAFRRIEMFLYF